MEFLRPAHFLEVLSSNYTWHKNWWFGKYLQSTTFTRVNYTQSKASLYLQLFGKARSIFCKKQFTTLESERETTNWKDGNWLFPFLVLQNPSTWVVELFDDSPRMKPMDVYSSQGMWGMWLYCRGYWAVSLTLWIAGSHPFVHSHSCFQKHQGWEAPAY